MIIYTFQAKQGAQWLEQFPENQDTCSYPYYLAMSRNSDQWSEDFFKGAKIMRQNQSIICR